MGLQELSHRKWGPYLALLLIVVGTAVFYAPAVNYGIFWDDPVWYGHALGKTWWQTLLPSTDFQFYRPLSSFYVWLFLRPDGAFAFEWLHRLQIGYHLANTVLAYAIGRRLGMSRWAAVAASGLLAAYPFLYQAVAWAAPNQPMAGMWQSATWLAYFAARPLPGNSAPKRANWLLFFSLIFYLCALMVQESSVAVAFVPLLYELLLRQKISSWDSLWKVVQSPRKSGWGLALVYVGMALVYGLIWLSVPRRAGITQLALEGETAVYLLQGVLYPLAGPPFGKLITTPALLIGLAVVGLGGLWGLAAWQKRGRLALLALVWTALSLSPIFIGLEFNYVGLANRLFYAAVLPIVLLWAAALWPALHMKRQFFWSGPIILLLVIGQSAWILRGRANDLELGTSHLNAAIGAMAEGDGRYLFINFPDRYLVKDAPYPFGGWGVTLAPVVVDLADFIPVVKGGTAVSRSYSMPWLDLAERESGPYQVDMRGVIIQPNDLVELVGDGTAVYVSRYEPDGQIQLQYAGAFGSEETGGDCLARFDDTICLHAVDYWLAGDEIEVELAWWTERPLPPNLTVFVHLGQPGQPPIAQSDGDVWRGLLPLSDWPTGKKIIEQRNLPTVGGVDGQVLQIGIYNRESGNRLKTKSDAEQFSLLITFSPAEE